MKQIHTKLLSGLLSLSMLVSLSIPVFAYNSIGSNSDLDNLIGEDQAQEANTQYHDPISGQSSAQTDVYVTRSSTFTVLVPKTIILSGDTGIGSYVVGAKGDVLFEDSIVIEPDSYELTLYKKGAPESTVEALISQEETKLTGDTIEAASPSYALLEGLIEASDLRAGSWSTKIQFNINLVENECEHELTHVFAVAATPLMNGNIEYWYCPDCDSYFEDETAEIEIEEETTVLSKDDVETVDLIRILAADTPAFRHGEEPLTPPSPILLIT